MYDDDFNSKNTGLDDVEQTPPKTLRVGKYELLSELGSGGMATVYLARLQREAGFERLVAVKRIHEHMSKEEKFRTMFLDEARIAARVQHPNVIQVTDFGVEEDAPYLVMEYINGENFAGVLRTCWKRGKPFPIPVAVRIVACACEGLHHAHDLKNAEGTPLDLVHRDVSPHNLMISYEGIVKLTDFGIAKAVDRVGLSRSGSLKGKITYMSPEQVLAQPLDRRSDVFALGTILFESTLGRRLFRAESEFETLQRIISAQVPFPTSIDPGYPKQLEAVIMRALAASPDDRYQTAREMQQDLEKYLAKTGKPVGTVEIGEVMEKLFASRRKAREKMLASILKNEQVGELKPMRTDTSTSVTLPGPILTTHSRGRSKLSWYFAAGGVLLVALGVSLGWFMASTRTPTEDQRLEGSDRPTVAGSDNRATVGPSPMGPDSGYAPRHAADGATADAGRNEVDARPSSAEASGDANPTPDKRRGNGRRENTGPPGRVNIIANPWCEVFLGSKRLGRTPIVGVSVPSGRQVLTFYPRGKRPGVRRPVSVRAGQTTPVSVNLTE